MTLRRNMCVLSSHTCGVCLAKCTGQSWKETYEGILPLKTWTLVLNKSFQLCIEGRYDDYGLDLVICIPVKKRVNSRWVANERTLIKLHGPLFSKDLPDFVVARFSDGIPENWKVVAEKWVDFVGHGENSSFSLNFTLASDSSRGSRNRRTLGFEGKGAGAGGRARSQRRNAASAKHQSSDSAVHSIQGSSATPSNWVNPSPWLPLHKVKEITQWMNRSPVTPLLAAPDSEPGDGGCIVDLHLDGGGMPSSAGVCTPAASSSPQLSILSRQRQLSGSNITVPSRQRNYAIAQSTPLAGTQDIRPSANPLNLSMTMSSVSHMDLSSGLSSLGSGVPQDDLFRKPMLDAHGVETPVATSSEAKKTESSAKRVSKVSLSPSKPVEAPGAEIGRMENSSRSRPLRKHSPQKIERWRPILGVDGNIKLQGYLVLRGDMTAGQILTTNTVLKWSGTQVTTCDKREYELIGDMYDPSGKISATLKTKLKKAMKCSDIQEALQETQALRDRSDWGAEYDIFYQESANPEKSSSSPAGTNSSTRRNNNSSSSCNTSSTRTPRRPPRRSRAPEAPLLLDSPSSSSGQGSPSRKSLRLSKKKRKVKDSDYDPSSSNKKQPQQQTQLKKNSSSYNNNHKADYVMHVSPSRIKVSYPTKHTTPTTPLQQGDTSRVRCRPQTPEGARSRTPRCPAKLSCDTCCGPTPPPSLTPTTPTPTTAAAAVKKKQQQRQEKKKKIAPPVDRTLRGTLGKTRLQTLQKSPRLIISPLNMKKLKHSRASPRKLFASSSSSSSPKRATSKGKEEEKEQKEEDTKDKEKVVRGRGRPPQKKEKEMDKKKKKNNNNRKSGTKRVTKVKGNHKTTRQKTRCATPPLPAAAPPATPTEVVDLSQEDNASVCSNASDMSVGPSASVIFAMNAAVAEEATGGAEGEGVRGRGPRTLRERRKRDAALQRMKELVDKMADGGSKSRRRGEGGGGEVDDDDPVAQLISAKPFQPLPQEWCDHSKWIRRPGQGGRKRRRPSSSDGTASPSRSSALSSDGGHEDATSSVATPQLLMRRPDPKQVQSYLQRLRAMNSKPHRPTRRARADRQFHLPDIDYSQVFRDESSSDSGSASPVDSDWEG